MIHANETPQFDGETHLLCVCATYLTVRLAQLCELSVTTVRFYAGGRYKYLIDVNLTIFF